MSYDEMSPQQLEEYGQEAAYENAVAAEGERRHYRERELDLFFHWYFTRLDDIIRRDPSEAYEAFHERRLGLGLTEDQCETEKTAYLERKKNYFYQQGLTATGQIPF